ncbi:hypothetical protein [Streptomyces sp. NPDC000618]|uniref:hypothetical protein n=1 Tax=Streptomyces sp. NPDC000618 TaxID=3154265 RepID=UPI003329D297
MYDGDRRVQLADSYVPVDVAEVASNGNPDPGLGGIISRMRDVGYEQTEAIEEITLYAATSVGAEGFGVEVGTNLLQITHTGYTKTGRAGEVRSTVPAPAGSCATARPSASRNAHRRPALKSAGRRFFDAEAYFRPF